MSKLDVKSAYDISGENGIFDIVHTVKGVLVSYLISMLLLFLTAVIATYMGLSETGVNVAVNIVTALGLLACGFIVARRARRGGLFNGAIAGLLYTIVLYIVGSLITQSMDFTLSTVTTLVLGFICGGLGGIMGINLGRKRR